MWDIYVARGMNPEDAAALIDILAQYKEIFINTMMVEGTLLLLLLKSFCSDSRHDYYYVHS